MSKPIRGDITVDKKAIDEAKRFHNTYCDYDILRQLDQRTLRDMIFMNKNVARHLERYLDMRNEQGRGGD